MIDYKKSTDLGLSATERKELRAREAQEAISDHEGAQRAFHENRERLRENAAPANVVGSILINSKAESSSVSYIATRFFPFSIHRGSSVSTIFLMKARPHIPKRSYVVKAAVLRTKK